MPLLCKIFCCKVKLFSSKTWIGFGFYSIVPNLEDFDTASSFFKKAKFYLIMAEITSGYCTGNSD
jgi:hypothetical protein